MNASFEQWVLIHEKCHVILTIPVISVSFPVYDWISSFNSLNLNRTKQIFCMEWMHRSYYFSMSSTDQTFQQISEGMECALLTVCTLLEQT